MQLQDAVTESLKGYPLWVTQGIGIKRKELALVWHEKASRAALQTSLETLHILFVQTHNMTTVKKSGEQCCRLMKLK